MSRPIALCIERVQSVDNDRYLCCTARPGREAGLALGLDGAILWCHSGLVACEVWVSGDQRLVAFRPSGAPEVRLERARRGVALPTESPAFVLDGDELIIGEHRFVVHVHGVTDEVHPPRPIAPISRAAVLAAAVALSGVVGCGETDESPSRALATTKGATSQPTSGGWFWNFDGGAADAARVVYPAANDSGFPPGSDASDDDAGVIPVEIRNNPPLLK
jgi:hypothetical protein